MLPTDDFAEFGKGFTTAVMLTIRPEEAAQVLRCMNVSDESPECARAFYGLLGTIAGPDVYSEERHDIINTDGRAVKEAARYGYPHGERY